MRALICAAVLSLTLPAAAAETAGGAKAPVVKAAPAKAPGTPAAAPKPAPAPTTVPVAPDTFDATKEESGKEEGAHNGSSLKIPRFVSLRTDPINLRTGPGVRYPVDWVYVRRRLPVEVIAEFDTWRQIRDPDGAEGWVHQSMLSGRRTAVISVPAGILRREGSDHGATIATLEKGVIVAVQRCPAESDFCRVEVSGLQGWVSRSQIWGVYPTEPVQ